MDSNPQLSEHSSVTRTGSRQGALATLIIGAGLSVLTTGWNRADGAGQPSASAPASRTPLDVARRLAGSDPWLGPLLGGRGELDVNRSRTDALEATLPAHASGVLELRAGKLTRPLLTLRQLGAAASSIELVDGHALYRDVSSGVDSIWALRDSVLEQVLLVQRPGAWRTLVWEVERRADLTESEVEQSGALLFVDRAGTARVRIPPPYAIDAAGRRRSLEMRHDERRCGAGWCSRIAFSLDQRGLVFPLLVDPALEEVTWINRTAAQKSANPGWREGPALAYDEPNGVAVLFGGAELSFSGSVVAVHPETWTWNGQQWTNLGVLSPTPAPRLFHGMAYGPNARVVLYGGDDPFSTVELSDTWTFDAAAKSWKLEQPAISPPGLEGHAMAYDPVANVAAVYGGLGSDDHVWKWTGSNWVDPGETSITAVSPNWAAFARAPNNKLLELGGETLQAAYTGITWLYDVATNSWEPKAEKPYCGSTDIEQEKVHPCPRIATTLAYDSFRNVTVLFGGDTEFAPVYLDDTWEWDGQSWAKRAPLSKPAPRRFAAMAYDSKRKRTLLVGGDVPTITKDLGADTWEYYRYGGTCSTAADCEKGTCVDGVCCLDTKCGSCAACSASTGTCQPVVGDDPDSCTGAQTCSASGACKKKSGQSCGSADECASGHCADGFCCDRACTGACEACDLAASEGACTFVTGAPRHGLCAGGAGPCASSCTGTAGDCEFPAASTDCGSTCSGAIVARKVCDGAGACIGAPPATCAGNFACKDASTCRTTCGAGADCAPGYSCKDGSCVMASTCADDLHVNNADGTTSACGAYRCIGGSCLGQCASIGDCAPGFVCTPAGVCSSRAEDDEPGGCGCRTAPRRGGGATWLLALGAALWVARRRA